MFDVIRNRRSIREYTGETIPEEKIEKILEGALYSPKAGGNIAWKLHVVSNKDDISKVSKGPSYYQYFLEKASHLILVELDEGSLFQYYGKRGIELYGIQGSAAAIQNMLLLATFYGVGSCWIGAFDEVKLKQIFNLHGKIVAIISLGKINTNNDWRN